MDLGGGRSSPVEYVVIDEAPPADLSGDRMEGEILNFSSSDRMEGTMRLQLCIATMFCDMMTCNMYSIV